MIGLRRRSLAITSAAIISLGLLVGCAQTQPGSGNPEFVVATRPASTDTESDSAVISGELVVVNGCLGIADGERTVIPIFSENDPRIEDLAVGQDVDLTGGEITVPQDSFPKECQDASSYWSVANLSS